MVSESDSKCQLCGYRAGNPGRYLGCSPPSTTVLYIQVCALMSLFYTIITHLDTYLITHYNFIELPPDPHLSRDLLTLTSSADMAPKQKAPVYVLGVGM